MNHLKYPQWIKEAEFYIVGTLSLNSLSSDKFHIVLMIKVIFVIHCFSDIFHRKVIL